MIKAVIFDMDGVLVDSEPVYYEWVKSFLANQNVYVTEDELCSLVGISFQDYRRKLEAWWKRSKKEHRTGEEISRMFDNFCDCNPVSSKSIENPYAGQVMRQLRGEGYKIAVASSSPMKEIRKILSEIELELYVDVIVSGEQFTQSKPDPEIYLYTVNQLGLQESECIAVEDSSYGIQAAIDAGILVLAKEDIRFGMDQSRATAILKDLDELISFLSEKNCTR